MSRGATLLASVKDDRLSLLLDLGATLHREVGLDALLGEVGSRIARALVAERATVFVVDAATGELRSRIADLAEVPEIRVPAGQGIAGAVAASGRGIRVDDVTRDARFFAGVDLRTGFRTRSLLAVPMRDARRAIRGVVQAVNKREGAFSAEDEAFLTALASQLALAFEWTSLRSDGAPRGVWVRGPYNHIVGDSPAMRAVYDLLQRVSSTDATVLLTGETGTGKGLVARAIAANGPRAAGPFVTVDCTTLPEALVESELFGHERGAFTGADRRVPGKIEGAQGGTLFLDEVGELPPAAQAKLLRVLQERRFERVGGREPVDVDVRVITATHRELAREVRAGRFREDLFYRLRVVELELPPLRARGPAEIVALARHFLGVYSRRHRRDGVTLGDACLAAMAAHRWPGNVRELEHAIERAVVLSDGVVEPAHLGLLPSLPSERPPGAGVTLPLDLSLEEASRRYCEAVLSAAGGNSSEAARRLRVGRNTLARRRG